MSHLAIPSATRRQLRLPILACAILAAWGMGWSAIRIATEGVGVLGANNAVPWGWDIVLFVFWIGLGHAGTLISAILLLTGQHWRNSIARHAELMTLCAVCTAAIFPLIHVGRAWMLWQMFPLRVPSGTWPDMASALVWDAAAISAYFLLSALFFCMGLRGEKQEQKPHRPLWAHSTLLMAGILTPLVIMVHSIVGSDFALTLRWQSVIIPPYFVCGAILSGMAAVQIIALLACCRIGIIGKLGHLTAAISGAMGLFYAYELITEPHLWGNSYACMVLLNVIIPLGLLSFRKLRHNRAICALVSIGILIGMWQERVHIIVERSLHLTGGSYTPSSVDLAMLFGSIGLFLALYLSIVRLLPHHTTEPRKYIGTPAPSAPRTAALIGGSSFVIIAVLWAGCSQWADTAGTLGSSPHGFLYYLPALIVIGLFGAGLGVFLHYIKTTRPS
ncbi:MAG: polysulfide reductase NrfD [Akkermansia sp.]|nr:polysulfide reductase NrfD [Akkermansia sp.]